MKVLVASHDLWPTPAIASRILTIMLACEDGFSVRCNRERQVTSAVEEMTLKIGERIGRKVHAWAPTVMGSRAGFVRDNMMVAQASEVIAFFHPSRIMDGGTGHVVDVALRLNTPVVAYSLDDNGELYEVATTMSVWTGVP